MVVRGGALGPGVHNSPSVSASSDLEQPEMPAVCIKQEPEKADVKARELFSLCRAV